MMNKKFLEAYRDHRFLYLLIALLCVLILGSSVNRYFSHDEFEHVHAAWYIQDGSTPYVDFFENHHPLLWFLLLPFLALFGHVAALLIVLRLFVLLFTFGIGVLVFRTARLVTRSRKIGLYALILLLSMVMFVEKGIEIRPDVPQLFFGLLSLYYLLLFFNRNPKTIDMREPLSSRSAITHPVPPAAVHPSQEGNQQSPPGRGARRVGWVKNQSKERSNKGSPLLICLSALSAAVSFLFLQKSIFLLLALGAILLAKRIKGEISFKALALFAVCLLLPIVLFAGYLLVSGSFRDYLLTNWLVHIFHLDSFSPWRFLTHSLEQNSFFWLLAAGALLVVLVKRGGGRELKVLTGLALFLFAAALLVKHPYRQYFLFPIALLCIPAAYLLHRLFSRFKLGARGKIAALLVLVFVPLIFLFSMMIQSSRSQLARIDFVLQNSKPSDQVYDGDIQFNLFRKDVHYFWFGIKNRGLDTYNRLTGGRFADYDIVQLIKEKRPKIISDVGLDLEHPGLAHLYKKTPHKNIYIRKW